MAESRDIDPADFPGYPELDPTGHVDISQIDCSLTMTPAQRIRQLEHLLEFARLAQAARIKLYGFDPSADPAAETPE
jgi:hypothetical protein